MRDDPRKRPCDVCGADAGEPCVSRMPPHDEVGFHAFRRDGVFDPVIHAERREQRLRYERLAHGDRSEAIVVLVELLRGLPGEERTAVLAHFCAACAGSKEPGAPCPVCRP